MFTREKSSKIWAGVSAVLLALCLCVAAPVGQAHAAEVTRSIDSTMTVTLQQSSTDDETNDTTDTTSDGKGSTTKGKKPVAASEKGGGLALTGDALLLAMLGIVALASAAAYCLLQSKNLSVVEGAHTRGAHTRNSQRADHARGRKSLATQNRDEAQKKMIAATIAAALVAATCFGGFASKTNALAEAIGELISCNSLVVVDESGNVVSSNITIANNTSKKIRVEEAVAPSKLSTWEATFAAKDVASKTSAAGTWDGKTVPEDVLSTVKSNGSATLKFQLTFKYDNTETSGTDGKVTVYDPVTGKEQVITVTDSEGNPIKDAVVDTDVNGKTNVIIPDEAIDKDVVVTITDEENKPEAGKDVEIKNEDETTRDHGPTDDNGQIESIANGGKTDENGEVKVDTPENLTIKVTDDQNNPIEGATVSVDKETGHTTVILPEEAQGKNVVVIITDESGNGKEGVDVTVKNDDNTTRVEDKTNTEGKVEANANEGITDKTGETTTTSPDVIKSEVTYDDDNDPSTPEKPVPGAKVEIDENGNVTVTIPDDSPATGKEITVTTKDEDGNPVETDVTVKEKDFTLGPTTTDPDTGEATFPGREGTTDDDGKVDVIEKDGTVIKTEITYDDDYDPSTPEKPVPGAKVEVDDEGNIEVTLPEDSPASGKEITVITKDKDGDPVGDKEVTLIDGTTTRGPETTDGTSGEATFPGREGKTDSEGTAKVIDKDGVVVVTTVTYDDDDDPSTQEKPLKGAIVSIDPETGQMTVTVPEDSDANGKSITVTTKDEETGALETEVKVVDNEGSRGPETTDASTGIATFPGYSGKTDTTDGTTTVTDPKTGEKLEMTVTYDDDGDPTTDPVPVPGAEVVIDKDGNVTVTLPETPDVSGKEIIVVAKDEEGTPVGNKDVTVIDGENTRGPEKTDDTTGEAKFPGHEGTTDDEGKVDVLDKDGETVIKAEITYDDDNDPSTPEKPVPGAKVEVDDEGNIEVTLPDYSPASGKEITVKTTDEDGNPEGGREVTLIDGTTTRGPETTDETTGEASFPGHDGTTNDKGETEVIDKDGNKETVKVVDKTTNEPIEGAKVEVDPDTNEVTVKLPEGQDKGADIEITVTEDKGDGTTGGKKDVSVTLEESDGEDRGTGTTKDDGKVEFKALDYNLFSLQEGTWTYDKTQKKPTVSCTGTLVENTDYQVTYGENINAGEGTVTVTGLGSYSGSKDFTFTIDKAKLTVTGIKVNSKTYDAKTDATFNYENISVTGKVGSDTVSATATGTFPSANVGTQTVNMTLTPSGTDSANYQIDTTTSQSSAQGEITKATVAITWNTTDSFVYNGTDQKREVATVTGVNNETLGVTLAVQKDGATVTEHKNVGTYTSVATAVTGATASNYDLPTAEADLKQNFSITQKTVKVSGITASDKTYDGTTDATLSLSSLSWDGIEEGDSLELVSANVTGSFASKNASDTAQTVTIAYGTGAIGGTSAANYTLAAAGTSGSQQTTTAKISKAALTFTWTYADAAPEYDAQTHTPTLTVTGNASGETVTPNVTYAKKGDETATSVTPKDAATYVATASISTTEAVNYSLPTNATFEFAIAQRTVGVTWDEFNSGTAVTYDGADHATAAPTATINTNVSGESLTATVQLKFGDSTTTEVKKAGSYTASVASLAAASTTPSVNMANYKVASTDVKTFSIAQLEVEIAWTNTTIKWDGTAKKPTATVSNKIGDDVVNVTVTGEKSDEGTYTATADALTGAAAENYKLPETKPTTQFSIKRMYTVTFKELATDGSTVAVTGVDPIDVVSGEKCNKPATDPEKTGYIFKGWFTDSAFTEGKEAFAEDGTSKEAITADVTYYAKWAEGYKVKFVDAEDGTTEVSTAVEVAKGDTFNEPTDPVKTGKAFAGWYTTQACTTEYTFTNGVSSAVNSALTLYAKFVDALVVFDANAPSGTTATVDGTKATKRVIASGGNSTLSSTDVAGLNTTLTCNDTTYTFAGWAKSPGAANTANTDSVPGVIAETSTAMAGKNVSNGETYYAIWKDTNTTLNTGFWMSDAETTATGKQESDYTSKGHYLSSKQVLADVAVMKAGSSNSQYARVIEKWNEYYSKDLRLYSTWSGSDATAGTLNALVDFRILQVGEHDSDGSVVTFMATHSLPTAKTANSSATNAGGWASSALRTAMTDYVQAGLSSSLVSAMNPVQKVTTSGSRGSWVTGSTTTDTVWLLSNSEVFGTSSDGNTLISGSMKQFYDEGTRYAWFTKNGVNATSGWTSSNAAINSNYKTRAGGAAGAYSFWWLRSPRVYNNNSFGMVNSEGCPGSSGATYSYGVVPCFCF